MSDIKRAFLLTTSMCNERRAALAVPLNKADMVRFKIKPQTKQTLGLDFAKNLFGGVGRDFIQAPEISGRRSHFLTKLAMRPRRSCPSRIGTCP